MKIPRLDDKAVLSDAGLLALRAGVGATFLAHGVDKLTDLESTERAFDSLDIPAPAAMAPLVAVTETLGGGLLLAGLTVRLAGLALAGDMLVAFLTAHLGKGFFVNKGGGEFVLVLGGASLALALTGPGRISVDAIANGRARNG